MSGSLGKSESSSRNEFNQDVFGPQADALENLYGQVGGLFDQTTGGAANQNQFGQDFSQQALQNVVQPWQQQLQGGAYQGLDLQNSLRSSLDQSLNNPSATQRINASILGGEGNNYADALRGQFEDDANRATDNLLANLDSRAAGSGMSGGARQGVAIARGVDDINRNLQRNLTEVGYNTFENNLDRNLSIATQADANNFGRQQLMANLIGGQQGAINQGIENAGNLSGYGSQQQLLPWQQAGQYGQIIGGPEVLSSGFGNADSKAFQTSGGVSAGAFGGGG